MAIDEIIDRLYGLPLAEFTAARNEAARELRKAGEREAAERVKALRKPTAAAGAVNRLVREQRGEVEQFLQAAVALRDAQFSGKGDLATATRQEHEALGRLLAIGGEAVRQTLLAAAVDDDAARATAGGATRARTGTSRLRDPARARTAGGRDGLPARAAPQPAPPSPEREAPKPDDRAARARLGDAEAALSAAETEEREARRRWEEAQNELERARAAVETAQRDLDRLHGR